jgi:hypothetical protein
VAAVAALTGGIDNPRPYLEASDDEFDDFVARRRTERADRGGGGVRPVGRLLARAHAHQGAARCRLGIDAASTVASLSSSSTDALGLVHDADEVTLDFAAGLLRAPAGEARLRPLAPFAQEILAAGGVVAYLREHGDFPPVP